MIRRMSEATASIVKELNPGLEVQTDEQWADWLKTQFSTTWRKHFYRIVTIGVSNVYISFYI